MVHSYQTPRATDEAAVLFPGCRTTYHLVFNELVRKFEHIGDNPFPFTCEALKLWFVWP